MDMPAFEDIGFKTLITTRTHTYIPSRFFFCQAARTIVPRRHCYQQIPAPQKNSVKQKLHGADKIDPSAALNLKAQETMHYYQNTRYIRIAIRQSGFCVVTNVIYLLPTPSAPVVATVRKADSMVLDRLNKDS